MSDPPRAEPGSDAELGLGRTPPDVRDVRPDGGASLPARLETKRLLLRPLRETDAEALYGIFSDPEVVRYSGGRSPSLDEVRAGIQRHIANYYGARGFGLMVAELRRTGAVIGRVGLLTTDLDDLADAELHYHLHPACWGNGLATEAVQALLRWAFGCRRLERIVAAIHPHNTPSRRVAEKCGLRVWSEESLPGSGTFLVYAAERTDYP